MARSFSSGDSRQIIREHERLLGFLKNSINEKNRAADEVRRQFQTLLARGGFSNIIRTEMKNNAPAPPSWETERFFNSLCALARRDHSAAQSEQLLKVYGASLDSALSDAKAGSGGLRRLFSSNEKKNRADRALSYLSSILSGDYGNTARGLESESAAAQKQGAAASAAEIAGNKAYYRSLIQRNVPEVFTGGSPLREFDSVLRELDKIGAGLRNAEQAVNLSREEIKNAVKAFKGSEGMKILDDVPVEEINRGSEKLRVKSLRDAGYNTMGDIHRASVGQLSSVNGISPEGAQRIKEMAAGFLNRSTGSAHVRLSADDKTPAATNLVCAICLYRAKREGIKRFEQLRSDYSEKIKKAENTLKSVGSGAVWLFYENDDKQKVIDSYTYLGRLIKGDYAKTAAEVGSLCSGAARVAPDAAWKDFEQHTVEYMNVLDELAPDALGNENDIYGLPEELAQAIAEQPVLTDGLSCTLRPYQTWGVKYILHQGRTLLGDEMGLGKTVQAIASMVSLRNSGATHFMVVCPASVLSNWCREIEKHSDLKVTKIHGSDRASSFAEWQEKGGVGVTTFETTAHLPLEDGKKFAMMVVDEAHYIKNPEAARSKNVRALCAHAQKLLFMTGTALENKVNEMIELVGVLRPELSESISGMAFMASAPQFREAVAPVYYRRKRSEVLKELPELTQSEEWCRMTAAERSVYEQAVLDKRYADVRRVSWNVGDISQSSKANRLREIVEEAQSEGRKIIVFSFFLDTIKKIAAIFGESCVGPINGSIPPQRRQELIDEFDKAQPGAVLAAQIQSGGTGLNIQSASVVVLCEPQFKPSIENQAISRAYRMGQARNVLVFRLLCEDTADEKIMKLLEQKQAVFDAFADDSAVAEETFELDEKGFGEIVREEAEKIQSRRTELEAEDNE